MALEAVSATASIGGLIELSWQLVERISHVCRDIREAEKDLKSLETQVRILRPVLERLKESEFYKEEQILLQRLVKALEELFSTVEAKCNVHKARGPTIRKFTAVWKKSWLARSFRELESLKSLATLVLPVLSHNYDPQQAQIPKEGDRLLENAAVMESNEAQVTELPNTAMASLIEQQKLMISAGFNGPTRSVNLPPPEVWSYIWSTSFGRLDAWSKRIRPDDMKTVQLRMRSPFFNRGVNVDFYLDSWYIPSPLLGQYLSYPVVVDPRSEFIEACKNGRFKAAEAILMNRQADPNCVTPDNMTPLLYAIQSGKETSTDLVKKLLENGANPNYAAGSSDTCPLAWAIRHNSIEMVRALVDHGCTFDHVSALGWSPIFYCWSESKMKDGSFKQTEIISSILEILRDKSPMLDFEGVDTHGWTALEMAAAFGTAHDLKKLHQFGADIYSRCNALGWSTIHVAVNRGNWNTYSWLCEKSRDTAPYIVDNRGWSLLHIAASMGHGDIIKDLLKRGASLSYRTQASRKSKRTALNGRECIAEEVAKACGKRKHEIFVKAVTEMGLENQLQATESVHVVQIFDE